MKYIEKGMIRSLKYDSKGLIFVCGGFLWLFWEGFNLISVFL